VVEIDDDQNVVAEPGGAKDRPHPPLLLRGFEPQQAERLPLLGLGEGEYFQARNLAEFGAQLAHGGAQARLVRAPAKRQQSIAGWCRGAHANDLLLSPARRMSGRGHPR